MKVYVSGPITAHPNGIAAGERALTEEAARLRADGHDVVNPVEVQIAHTGCATDPRFHLWHCYMRHDLREMLTCEAIYLLPGWESSPGARLELHVAASCGLRVFRSPEVLA